MDFTSLVALKSKTGELDAAIAIEPAAAERVQLLVELVVELKAEGGRLLSKLDKTVVRLHELGQVALLDATRLHRSSALWDEPQGPLNHLSRRLIKVLESKRGLFAHDRPPFIPVASAEDSDARLADIALVREAHDCPVGLRVGPKLLFDPRVAKVRILHCVNQLNAEPHEVMLLLDLDYVLNVVQAMETACLRLIDMLKPEAFASVTLLAGGIPDSRGRPLVSGEHQRRELVLWRRIASRLPGVRYGDYGVVHPRELPPRKSNTPMNTPNPYVYYTCPEQSSFYVRRMNRARNGRPLPGEHPGVYFKEIAEELVGSQEYCRNKADAWGDRELGLCASGDVRAAGSARWIAIGTSHHIAHLATQVVWPPKTATAAREATRTSEAGPVYPTEIPGPSSAYQP